MKTLHLHTENQNSFLDKIVEIEEKSPGIEVEKALFTKEDASEILKKIFAADSVCVWN